jgi:AraC family transcriptional regulator, transcriptional activator of pobA
MNNEALTLINPQNGNLAFKVFAFDNNTHFDHVQRNNYYSLIWVTKGNGTVHADFKEYNFEANSLFAFSPYQPFMIASTDAIQGIAIQFHSDFYCIHFHQKEVACNGILFNNVYQPPITVIDSNTATTMQMVIAQMKTEMQNQALAQYELLVSYLKIFLISVSRLKALQLPDLKILKFDTKQPFVLQSLQDAIEKDFKTKHSASDYAKMLNISANALAKITKTHFNKTLTEIIAERIIIEAKRELFLTHKPIKEIAYDLGYDDEFYFSRFFKNKVEVSPQMYRDTVGFGRGFLTEN